jgi:hypothetical protein
MKIGTIGAAALFSLGVLVCFPALAQPAGGGGSGSQGAQKAGPGQGQDRPNFETIKAQVLQNHQARIQALQQSLTCIQAAKDHEALRACRQSEHQAMEQMRGQHGGGGRQGGRGGPGQGSPGQQGGPQRQ